MNDKQGMSMSRNNQRVTKTINTTVSEKLEIVKEVENKNCPNLIPQNQKEKLNKLSMSKSGSNS